MESASLRATAGAGGIGDDDSDEDVEKLDRRYGERIGDIASSGEATERVVEMEGKGGTKAAGATTLAEPIWDRQSRPRYVDTRFVCGRLSALIERSRRLLPDLVHDTGGASTRAGIDTRAERSERVACAFVPRSDALGASNDGCELRQVRLRGPNRFAAAAATVATSATSPCTALIMDILLRPWSSLRRPPRERLCRESRRR
mmetsp:Transcript_89260/g.254793  ORF Transcript_89260/g.254793 Transcript_89260/m.254793 type:complete len:202 (-) Transcript_89260:333-938(-)